MIGGRLVAVTGASGFLGAHIITSLSAAGARIRILLHRQPPHPLWRDMPVEIMTGNLMDAAGCGRLVAGADAVIHAAGLIKARSNKAFSKVNGRGTAILAQAVRDVGPACRFVLVSSLAAREPSLSAYAASKREGEQAAREIFAATPEQLAILRPPAIYGPWDRETLPFFKAGSSKVAPLFGAGHAAIMHVQDAANAITQVALNDTCFGCYALAGPDLAAFSPRELAEAVALAVGGNPILLPMPAAVLRAAGSISGWTARLSGRTVIFTAGKARELLHPDWTVSRNEVLPFSIFQPSVNLQEGLRRTVAWYRNADWLS